MIRDYSLHPVKRTLEHVDFVEVKLDGRSTSRSRSSRRARRSASSPGGILRVVYRTVPVRCLPDRIPVKIETDVTHLELGEHIATQDLKLPEGVDRSPPAEQTLVAVVAPEKESRGGRRRAPAAAAAARGRGPGCGCGAAPAADAKKDDKKDEKKGEKSKKK